MVSRKGMCSTCKLSVKYKDPLERHMVCLKYSKESYAICQAVARNCPGALVGALYDEVKWQDHVSHKDRKLFVKA